MQYLKDQQLFVGTNDNENSVVKKNGGGKMEENISVAIPARTNDLDGKMASRHNFSKRWSIHDIRRALFPPESESLDQWIMDALENTTNIYDPAANSVESTPVLIPIFTLARRDSQGPLVLKSPLVPSSQGKIACSLSQCTPVDFGTNTDYLKVQCPNEQRLTNDNNSASVVKSDGDGKMKEITSRIQSLTIRAQLDAGAVKPLSALEKPRRARWIRCDCRDDANKGDASTIWKNPNAGLAATGATTTPAFQFRFAASTPKTGSDDLNKLKLNYNAFKPKPAGFSFAPVGMGAPNFSFGVSLPARMRAPIFYFVAPTRMTAPNFNFGIPARRRAPNFNFGVPPGIGAPNFNVSVPARRRAPNFNFGVPPGIGAPNFNFGILAASAAPAGGTGPGSPKTTESAGGPKTA